VAINTRLLFGASYYASHGYMLVNLNTEAALIIAKLPITGTEQHTLILICFEATVTL